MEQKQSTLDVIYDNWQTYNGKLRTAVAPLTDEQLARQPAAGMWPVRTDCATYRQCPGWLV